MLLKNSGIDSNLVDLRGNVDIVRCENVDVVHCGDVDVELGVRVETPKEQQLSDGSSPSPFVQRALNIITIAPKAPSNTSRPRERNRPTAAKAATRSPAPLVLVDPVLDDLPMVGGSAETPARRINDRPWEVLAPDSWLEERHGPSSPRVRTGLS